MKFEIILVSWGLILVTFVQLAQAEDGVASQSNSEMPSIAGRMVAGYQMKCGISPNGALLCWGELDDSNNPVTRPRLVDQGPWVQVGLGVRNVCAIKQTDNKIYCMGTSIYGELGDGKIYSSQSSMTPIQGDQTFSQLSVGPSEVCGVTTTRRLFCFGSNSFGQLGNGNSGNDSGTPTEVLNGGTDWVSVSVGQSTTCALKADGTGWCFGSNGDHQITPGNTTMYLEPTEIAGGPWKLLFAGSDFTLGIDMNGQAQGWGLTENIGVDSSVGATLGNNETMCYNPENNTMCKYPGNSKTTNQPTPTPVAGAKSWAVLDGARIPCGIETGTNHLYCWGYALGEAAVEGSPNANYPVAVTPVYEWASISSSPTGARCGILANGTGMCWGENTFNCESDGCSLGDGTTNNSATPVKVAEIESWLPGGNTPSPTPTPTPAPAPGGTPDVPTPVTPSSGAGNTVSITACISTVFLAVLTLLQ